MRLAFFSPFRPQPSGISDYSEELLPYLAQYAEIDLFFDGATPTSQKLIEQFAIYPMRDFSVLAHRRRYDTYLYQMGNSSHHTAIYTTLRQYPGITVLHEHILHHFIFDITANKGDWAAYWRELLYNTNLDCKKFLLPKISAFSPNLPLARRVIELSLGVIVHSQDMVNRVLADLPQARVAVAPMGMPLPLQLAKSEEQTAIRHHLNLPANAYIVSSFGYLSHHKRIDVLLRSFAQLRQQLPEAFCLIVGRDGGDYDLPLLLKTVGLDSQSVIITGFVTPEVLPHYIQATDVCVNLRYPTYGETSAAALRLMAYGKPIIVSDVATFAELPDEACIRVGVNAAETELLYRYLLLLAQRPQLRVQLGNNARRYVQEHHTLDYAANKMVTAIQNILVAVEKGNREI
jgi:glycosyltransferase involved in cell wall biosynthesis